MWQWSSCARGHSHRSLDDLRRHAEGRLARHKLPEDLLVVAELPRTAMEKVDRRALQKLVSRDGRQSPNIS